MEANNWRQSAICWGLPLDQFYSTDVKVQGEAKRICGNCPVSRECLADALKSEAGTEKSGYAGIRGGLTPFARWRLNEPEAAEAEREYQREYKRRNAEKGRAQMVAYRLRKKAEAA